MENFVTKILHLPPVAAEHGPGLDNLMFYVHLLMFALLVGWSVFFVYTIYRFRQRKNPKANHYGVRTHASTYLEAAVALVEAVLLIGFAVPLWARAASASNFPAEKDAVVVRVIGRQFNWVARYPGPDRVFGKGDPRLVTAENPLGTDPNDPNGKDDVVVQNSEMYVPLGKPVIAHIGALDVIHSFAVKPLRIAQDAIPGLSIPIWFKPTVPGSYQINCAQLCGNGHSTMRGLLHVVPPEEFDAWLKKQAKSGGGAASYE
jgi:cytochrome c oxidase subunit 2